MVSIPQASLSNVNHRIEYNHWLVIFDIPVHIHSTISIELECPGKLFYRSIYISTSHINVLFLLFFVCYDDKQFFFFFFYFYNNEGNNINIYQYIYFFVWSGFLCFSYSFSFLYMNITMIIIFRSSSFLLNRNLVCDRSVHNRKCFSIANTSLHISISKDIRFDQLSRDPEENFMDYRWQWLVHIILHTVLL